MKLNPANLFDNVFARQLKSKIGLSLVIRTNRSVSGGHTVDWRPRPDGVQV